MVPPEAPYPDVYTDTFIFFLRPLCKIIWMNVHYFPNAPRKYHRRQVCYIINHILSQMVRYNQVMLNNIDKHNVVNLMKY